MTAARALVLTLAVWVGSWWLGLEQILPGVAILWAAAMLFRRGRLEVPPEAFFWFLFLAWSLLSWFAIEGASGAVLWARGEVHLFLGVAAFLVGRSVTSGEAEQHILFKGVILFALALQALSVLVALGLVPLYFRGPLAVVAADLGAQSKFLHDFVLYRQLGTEIGESLFASIPRQSLLFLYQGGLATGLVVLQGLLLVARERLEGLWRRLATLAVALGLGVVLLTGSRAGILVLWSVVVGLVIWRLIEPRPWRRWAVRIAVVLVLLGALVAVIPRGDGTSLKDGALWERVLIDVRVKSFLDRYGLYRDTITQLNERPWTGWGIQGRPGETERYLRLGTHSELLNVGYRFGWVGLALYLSGAGALIWRLVVQSGLRRAAVPTLLTVGALSASALVRTFQWDFNVLWLLASYFGLALPLVREREALPGTRIGLAGLPVDARTAEELTAEVVKAGRTGEKRVIGHLNMHGLRLAQDDTAMEAFCRRADTVFIDGMPLVGMARWLGYQVERDQRVTYSDWINPLLAAVASHGLRVMHVGGRPGVGERATEVLKARHPGLIMESHPGYLDQVSEEALLKRIGEERPHVLLVGMGMPLQERWVLQNLDRLASNAILTCGACMDYVAGEIPTPPRWAGRVGLEWLFRLLAEPRRLGYRYLIEPWPVLVSVFRERWALGRRGS